jgi:RNA polymerase sigma-70 factor (ECF subfamily)
MLPPYADPLVARARAGDEQAIAELWRDLNPPLLRYLRGRIRAGAEDIASQTWLDATRGLHEFRGGDDDFRRWLFTIARRRLIDEVRRRGRQPATGPWPPPDDASRADSGADRYDDLTGALALVQMLPGDQADAVLLRVVADLDVGEVATIMGRSEGSVRVLVHRGLRRLQTILEERRVTQHDPSTMYREQ